jgi:hypothetical protein
MVRLRGEIVMKTKLDDADRLVLYRLLEYLAPKKDGQRVWTLEHACIEAHETWNRFGIPADSTSWRISISYPDAAWTVTLRMVWRDGGLLRPLATHVALEKVFDDEEQHGGPAGVVALFGEWLRSLPF